MQIDKLPVEFEQARPILKTIEDAGYEAYFVGGSVRDTLLNKPIHDVDIATSAYPAEIKSLFKKTVDTGIEHGTVMVLLDGIGYEVTTFRTESGYQDYRRPDHVTFVRSLEEDLKRRDFTINAFALKESGELVDKFNGLSDLKNKILRAVGDPNSRFNEDALRMMRAVRFASQLNFTIENTTAIAIREHAQLLAKISVERILTEFEKMMLGTSVKNAIEQVLELRLNQYMPNSIQLTTALTELQNLKVNELRNNNQVWAALILYGDVNSGQIDQYLKQWKTANSLIRSVRNILNILTANEITPDLLFSVGLVDLTNAVQVAKIASKDWDYLLSEYEQLPVKNMSELAVTGRDLISAGLVKPGPQMGKIIAEIKTKVLNQEILNDTEQILNYIQNRN